ncbi:NAD(P)H-binding protein [Nocardiopsis aegyptia]|uniref:Uncharacterized protein YbjT (DUF2867 family)/ketosteroid isomerase-like protein n=1 Tax=Nocardiopsis aegyptia TaxID=220378 RepID=A0A7Z0EMF2_9ACTN|nr:NAD(P)H-binding protein [Nocardiopsis aegyptia]NYJ34807.1 uncharacterized protein YbjT (DUF2867 family)/ketosteroid isomerase-like protein [Nocardiopsis aegyptia]
MDDHGENHGKYLVTGATGKVGGSAVRQLLDAGHTNVRALVRDPGRARLPAGVEVVRGDLSDPASLDAALDGVTRVLLVWPTLQADDAAPGTVARITRDARRVVYLSTMGAEAPADTNPVAASHAELERLIRESGAEWTFVRGGGFAGNDLGWAEEIRTTGVVREAFPGWKRSPVHEADLAAVALRALTTDDHVGAAYAVTGPENLDQAERVRIIGEVTGLPVRFEPLSRDEALAGYRQWLPPEAVEDTLRHMAEVTRHPEPVTTAVEDVTGRPALTYRRWVADHVAAFLPEDAREAGSTARVAADYVDAVARHDFDRVIGDLHAPDYVRVGSADMTGPATVMRADEIAAQVDRVEDTEEIHGVEIEPPLVRGDRFAVRFTFDSTDTSTGKRGTYSKVSLYTVRDGRIVREEVFFHEPPHVR